MRWRETQRQRYCKLKLSLTSLCEPLRVFHGFLCGKKVNRRDSRDFDFHKQKLPGFHLAVLISLTTYNFLLVTSSLLRTPHLVHHHHRCFHLEKSCLHLQHLVEHQVVRHHHSLRTFLVKQPAMQH